jgi:hypothetical protein
VNLDSRRGSLRRVFAIARPRPTRGGIATEMLPTRERARDANCKPDDDPPRRARGVGDARRRAR